MLCSNHFPSIFNRQAAVGCRCLSSWRGSCRSRHRRKVGGAQVRSRPKTKNNGISVPCLEACFGAVSVPLTLASISPRFPYISGTESNLSGGGKLDTIVPLGPKCWQGLHQSCGACPRSAPPIGFALVSSGTHQTPQLRCLHMWDFAKLWRQSWDGLTQNCSRG